MSVKNYLLFLFFVLLAFAWCAYNFFYVGIDILPGTDLSNYLNYYNYLLVEKSAAERRYEPGFSALFYIFAFFDLEFEFVLFFINFMFWVSVIFLISTSVKRPLPLVIVIICSVFFPVYSWLSEVVLRQGFSILLALLLGFMTYGSNRTQQITAASVATLFHYSFIVTLPFVLLKNISLRYFLAVWFICIFLYVLDIPVFLSGIFFEFLGFVSYFNISTSTYEVGFKFSFFVLTFSMFPLFLLSPKTEGVIYMYKFYMYISSLGLMASGFPYYDRLLSYAWILLPVFLGIALSQFKITKSVSA